MNRAIMPSITLGVTLGVAWMIAVAVLKSWVAP